MRRWPSSQGAIHLRDLAPLYLSHYIPIKNPLPPPPDGVQGHTPPPPPSLLLLSLFLPPLSLFPPLSLSPLPSLLPSPFSPTPGGKPQLNDLYDAKLDHI